jgi:hypothetical protein
MPDKVILVIPGIIGRFAAARRRLHHQIDAGEPAAFT